MLKLDFRTAAQRGGDSADIGDPEFEAFGLERWYRPVMVGLTAVALAIGLAVFVVRWWAFEARGFIGVDYDLWIVTAHRFLHTGSMYFPYQLDGPYVLQPPPYTPDIVPGIYPPHAIFLFLPLLVLPPVVWWLVPIGLTVYVIAAWRPAPWTWPIMSILLALPDTMSPIIVGGTTMWMVAFVAAGLRWQWPAVFVTLKPSLFPFALIGGRHRSWWIAASILGLASLPMLPLWFDWVTALRNSGASLLYSLGSVPGMLIPMVAYLGRQQEGRWRPRHIDRGLPVSALHQ